MHHVAASAVHPSNPTATVTVGHKKLSRSTCHACASFGVARRMFGPHITHFRVPNIASTVATIAASCATRRMASVNRYGTPRRLSASIRASSRAKAGSSASSSCTTEGSANARETARNPRFRYSSPTVICPRIAPFPRPLRRLSI